MNILDHGIHIAQMMSFEEIDNVLDLITVNGAKTLHIADTYGIEAGNIFLKRHQHPMKSSLNL